MPRHLSPLGLLLTPLTFMISETVLFIKSGYGQGLFQQKTVTVYCSRDQVYAEPILKEFHRRTGISVNAKYDSKAVKTVVLVNAIIAERERLRCHVLWNNGVMHAVNLKKMGLLAPHVHPVRKQE